MTKDDLFVLGLAAALATFAAAVAAWVTILPTIGLLWCVGILK